MNQSRKLRYVIGVLILGLVGAGLLLYSGSMKGGVDPETELARHQGDDTGREAPGAKPSRYRWVAGTAQSYGFSIDSDVQLDLPGSSGSQQILQRISGRLNMRVFDREGERIRVGFQLSPANYTINGQTNEGMKKSLSTPFMVFFEENGRPHAFRFPDSVEDTAQMILEEAMRTFQVILAYEKGASWTVAEDHGTGDYLADYQMRPDGSLSKQKTRYTELLIPFGSDDPSGKPKAQINESAMTIRISPETVWIQNASLHERMIITVGSNRLTDTTMKAELKFVGTSPDPDLALFSDGGWEEVLLAFSKESKQMQGDHGAGTQAVASSDNASGDLLTELINRVNDGDKGRIALLNDLEQLLTNDPDMAFRLIEDLEKPGITNKTESLCIHALERAGTPQAQEALVTLMNYPSYSFGNRLRAAIALGGVQAATNEAITSLLYAGRNREQKGRDLDLANTALLSAGSIGNTLGKSDPGRADWIKKELTMSLQNAGDTNETGMAIKAMGNTGDPALADTIIPYLKDASPFIRASAAQTLGRLKGEGTLPLLTDRLQQEESSMVRSAIVKGMEVLGNPSFQSLAAVNSKVLDEPDSKTRYHMVKYLGDNVDIYPEGENTLKSLLMTDRSKQIRKYAAAVLSKKQDR